MLEKKIKYTDFNGDEHEETFRFHISKAEMTRKEFTTEGGYSNYLQRIVETKDSTKLYKIFEELVCLSYGEKSDDGKRFIKERNGEPLVKAFMETPAYDELIMSLFDPKEASAFVKGIFPKDIVDQVDENKLMKQING